MATVVGRTEVETKPIVKEVKPIQEEKPLEKKETFKKKNK